MLETQAVQNEANSYYMAIKDNLAIVILNQQAKITQVNEKFLKLFGYKEKEVLGKSHLDFWDEKSVESGESQQFWNKILETGVQTLDIHRKKKDGTTIVIQATYIPIRNSQGEVIQVLVNIIDQTKRSKRDLNLQGKLEAIDKSQAIIEFDIHGYVITANDNFLRVSKYSLAEIKGKHHSFFCEESYVNSPEYKIFWEELRSGKYKAGQFKRLNRYDKIMWIQAVYSPIRDLDGNVMKIIEFAHDITREKELSLYYEGQLAAINKSQAVVEFGKEGIVIDANNIFLDMFSYELDEIQGKPHSIFCEENYVNSTEYKQFWEDLENGKYKVGQFKRITKDGRAIWIQASYNPIYGVDGSVTRIVKYAHNITKEKEISLYYEGQIEAIRRNQAVVEFNKNGVVLDANNNFLKILGYNLEDIKGKHHSIFCDKDFIYSEEYKQFWDELKEGICRSGQFKRIDSKGNIVWLQAVYNPIYGIDGKVMKIIKFATDITQEKEESLYYRGQIEAINRSQAVVEFDINGVVLNANNNFLATLGYTIEDIKGKHHSLFCDKVYAGSESYAEFWNDLKNGQYKSGQFKRVHKNGQTIFIHAVYNPIYGVDGKVASIVKFANDITEDERLNLFNKGKLESIGKAQAYMEFDEAGMILDANDNFLKIFKYETVDEIRLKHYQILLENEYIESQEYKRWFRELVNGKYQSGQYKLKDKYGNIVWLQATYSPIYGIDDKIAKIVQFSTDITIEKENEIYYKSQIEAINKSQMIIEFDINGIILNANKNFLVAMEYSIDEIRGKHHSVLCEEKLVNSNEYSRFWKELRAGKFQKGEYKRLNKQGNVVWLSATYNPIYDINGNVIKIVKYALDITEEKERGLYYKGQLNAINKSQAVIEYNVDGTIITANDNFLEAFHYHLDEIQNQHHRIFCESDLANSEYYTKKWQELAEGKFQSGQYKRLDKNGQIVWVQATYNPIYGVGGDVIKVIEFAHDITLDKEQSLYFKGQIDAISKSQAIVEFDTNGVVLNANDQFLNTFHYSLDEVLNMHHSMFCDKKYTSSQEYQDFWKMLKEGHYHSGQFKRINKEGKLVWIRASYNPIYGIDGKVNKIVKYAHDITEDKEFSLYIEGQVNAINRAQAVVEFDMNGTILNANKNFLNAMGYTLEEVKGKHHSMFCEEEYITSSEYHEFWEKLQKGLHDSGKYLRIGKNGKKVWIRATYTPILNIENEPIRILKYAQDITELETIKLDKLTGLYNNGKLVSDIKVNEINNLAMLESNEYKAINDFYGMLAGDTLIIQFSKILRKLVRNDFMLYRIHDDRFAILNNTLPRENFEKKIESIISKTNAISIDARVNYLNLSLNCGIAYGDTDEIIKHAKTALNHSKNTKQQFVIYSKDLNIEEQFQNKIFWSKKIKLALVENRFIINNQAILNNQNGKIEKHEILVRALDRDQSIIYPNQFLDIAKTSKQYLNITKIVIIKAFEKFKELPYDFSVNMTVEDILDKDMQQFLIKNIKSYGVGQRLIVEIVESEQIKEYKPIIKFFQRIKHYGVRLAIDDFGSGYSNFNHILELDADFVKIDGSIVRKVCENTYSATIIQSIVSFCKHMKIKTIAEFVSSKEIFDKIKEIGVDYSQGFYISKPQNEVQKKFNDIE